MKSIIQNYNSGELAVTEVPMPQLREGHLIVRNTCSVISAGTEKTKVVTAQKNLLGKAMARPDLVKQVINRATREGLLRTWQLVSDRLNTPVAMGYSCAGEVLEVAGDVGDLKPGDWVACGGSTANHAEVVCVPKQLTARLPEGVGVDQAAFTTLGAIAMQGVRQATVQLGESVAVIGLGLVGLLTTQMLQAAGCRVFGIDIDPAKNKLALELGSEEAVLGNDPALLERVLMFTDGYGFDAVVITAASPSNQPIELAAEITRDKGRVVVVGLTKMDIPREQFYHKEIDLRLSRSYGPGRYDVAYEEKGRDYPFGYVRFTENRNMISFLQLLRSKQVRVDPLITHRFPLAKAAQAYQLISGDSKEFYIGILLDYDRKREEIPERVTLQPQPLDKGQIVVGVIGAGKYATTNLLPWIAKNPGLRLGGVCTATGLTAVSVAEKFQGASAERDAGAVIEQSDAVLIATRHQDHARYALDALKKGKAVYVEKPLVIQPEQLRQLEDVVSQSPGASIMVGFNRRFAPSTQLVMEHFASVTAPRQIMMRINAGPIPKDHWIQDPEVGGGRLLGEGCHFVDLAVFLAQSTIKTVTATATSQPGCGPALWDNFVLSLGFANHSVASIVYTSSGDARLAKELIEVHGGGRSAINFDFQAADLWHRGQRQRKRWSSQDKGQQSEINLWARSLQDGVRLIAWEELLNVHRACFGALKSMQTGERVILS